MKLFFVEQIFLIFALSFSLSSGLNSYISIGRCNEWEQVQVETQTMKYRFLNDFKAEKIIEISR
jgi:hypothetical protein